MATTIFNALKFSELNMHDEFSFENITMPPRYIFAGTDATGEYYYWSKMSTAKIMKFSTDITIYKVVRRL